MRADGLFRLHLLLWVTGGVVAGCLPVCAWDGGCPAKPTGLVGGRSFEARVTDCPEITGRPLVVRTGEFRLGESLSFLASGFPGKWDHHIRLVDIESGERHPIRFWTAPRRTWVVKTMEVPEEWLGRTVVIEGFDPDPEGAWVGFSSPLSPLGLTWLRWAPRVRAISMTAALLALLTIAAMWAERKGSLSHA